MPAGSYARVLLDPEMQSFMDAAGWRIVTPEAHLASLTDHTRVEAVNATPAVWPHLSRNDPLEDFANSFALYFARPAELKRLSPARFAWFEAHFASLAQVSTAAQ